jgi:hypothetical protein
VCRADNLATFMCRESKNPVSLNLLEARTGTALPNHNAVDSVVPQISLLNSSASPSIAEFKK